MAAPTIPTTQEIYDRIVSDIESKIGQTTPILPKAFNRVIAAAFAGAFTILYKYGQWALRQIFTITQDADSLELKGNQYNILRKQASAAVLTVEFTGIDGVIIPTGTQFRGDTNGLVYSLETAQTIAGGTASGDMQCLTSGDDGNLLVGATMTILQPIAGLDNQATVTAIVVEGEDEEDIEQYRARIQEREKLPPQGGALVDYIAWAKEVPGITRAFAFSNRQVPSIQPGYISVYPISDDDPGGRIPSQAKLDEVHDYIDDPARAPLQAVMINVWPMIEIEFNVSISALSPDTTTVRERIEENITDYLLSREPQQFEGQTDLKNVVSRAGLEAICINSGAQSVTLQVDSGGAPFESYELEYNELAKLGTISWP